MWEEPVMNGFTDHTGGCLPVLQAFGRLVQSGRPAIAALDGRCGSGKTSLAALLQEHFPCRVVHMDDFYLPLDRRDSGWMETAGGNMDFARLLSEILLPARRGGPLVYRPYNCRAGRLSEAVELPARALTVVEGSYSTHPSLAEQYDLKVFLTCSSQEQRRRLEAREGERFSAFQSRWIPLEERYFRACGIQAQCDFVLDTTDLNGF